MEVTLEVDDFVNPGKEATISGKDYETDLPVIGGGSTYYETKVLPPNLCKNVVMLTCESAAYGGVCDVYLVGTVHVSTESCQEVQAAIDFLKPQVVFLELCYSRIDALKLQDSEVPTIEETLTDMWKKNHNPFEIFFCWFSAKVSSVHGGVHGAEFRVAYEEAKKYGAKVILGDRPCQITMQRTWAKMTLWEKTMLLSSALLVFLLGFFPSYLKKTVDEIDVADDDDWDEFPSLNETLVHERDQYMSAMLLKIARKHNSVVAVVGKGHLPGIQKYWKQPVDVKQLVSELSEKNIPMGKIVSIIGATVAGVVIVFGLHLSIKCNY